MSVLLSLPRLLLFPAPLFHPQSCPTEARAVGEVGAVGKVGAVGEVGAMQSPLLSPDYIKPVGDGSLSNHPTNKHDLMD